jgi:AcrR family transcriptional regulator
MPDTVALPLKPRKAPRQTRSKVTVDAVHEAAIQVLQAEGAVRFTTTRVAERAGVSVGTLYQYFPNKQALLHEVLRRRLDAISELFAAACGGLRGRSLTEIADGVARAYLEAKTARLDVARALYKLSAEIEGGPLVRSVEHRMRTRLSELLAGAEDAVFDDPPAVAFMLQAILTGTVRAVLERGADAQALAALRIQLPLICRGYLREAAKPVPVRSS